jgi:phosphoribosylanthranilate isomerase
MIVQIYGFTTPLDVIAVRELAIDHFGVVLDEGFETWDQVDDSTARAIVSEVPDGARTVALSLATDPGRIARTVETLEPDIVHLARAVGSLSPEDVERLRHAVRPTAVMVTVAVRDASALDAARAYAPFSDYLLLDTADPATDVIGATGLTHDWTLSASIPPAVAVPVILAGGLGPDNVDAAIRTVHPAGVDSETRTSGPHDRRRKNPVAVRRFVEAAHRHP